MTGFTIPSAGNAGGAVAAYAARAGAEAHVFMPKDVPTANRVEAEVAGARVVLVDGLISDAGKASRAAAEERGLFDVSTLQEPYRAEGKKTMGYEIAEQLGWNVPDVIVYPTGGGTGIVGIWKAFQEMEVLGWLDGRRPRCSACRPRDARPLSGRFTLARTMPSRGLAPTPSRRGSESRPRSATISCWRRSGRAAAAR